MTLTGDSALSGPMTDVSIRCDFPDLDGPTIAVLGKTYDGATSLRIGIQSGKFTARLFNSSDDGQYHERAFAGTGVQGFDEKKGAILESPVTETTATASAGPGSLGAITALKGSVDCREQRPGTSTLTLTGETAEGTLTGATLEHPRVECNQDAVGNEAVALGIVTTGSTKAFVSIGLRQDGLDLLATLASGVQHHYQAPAGANTATSTGGHANGDLVEQKATPPHTIHVEGDVTCGSPV